MPIRYPSLLVYVALACGACMNPAPELPAAKAPPDAPRVFDAHCEAASLEAAPPFASEPSDARPGALIHARLGACRGASPPEEGSCETQLTGWYALAYDLDVVYQDEAGDDSPAYDPGRGRLRMLFKAALRGTCQDEPTALTSLQLCGLTLPPLTSAAEGGWQALTVPAEAWDQPTQPEFETRVHAADTMDVDPTRIFLGIEPQAQGDDWPTFLDTTSFDCGPERQGSACFPDHDGDGQPGISVELPQAPEASTGEDCGSWQLTGLRTEGVPFAPHPRASRLYLGLRTALKGQFAFDETCEAGAGAADAEDVALRVLDCELTSGSRCNALQATYVDQHAPTFHVLHAGQEPVERMQARANTALAPIDLRPSQGGLLTAKRLGPVEGSVSCQDVRSAMGHPN
jgi:hypothetical protein